MILQYEVVIGLEVHAQLKTNTKIFCGCATSFGDAANSHGCPVCLGLPGALPVMNKAARDMAVLAGKATHCSIREHSIFARKNYFYADLPKGYQISQYEEPICEGGYLDISLPSGPKRLGITRIHLEEDAGKLIHDKDVDSLFDVNRCGTPLIEIVSEPDMRSSREAYLYLVQLKKILEYLDICDCNMEEGSFRCDANISLRPQGQKELGTKTELKNMNSFRNVEKAIEYEIARQKDILIRGGEVVQQTLLWDAAQKITKTMRTKEDAHDYRYFPDPDLAPVVITAEEIAEIEKSLPELPREKESRFAREYELDEDAVQVLTESISLADYFEEVVSQTQDIKKSAGWIMSEILRLRKERGVPLEELHVTPTVLADIIMMVRDGKISASAGKRVLNEVEESGESPAAVVDRLGLVQISDSSELAGIVDTIFAENPREVERLQAGEKKLISFFMGQVMKATRGKANPGEVTKIISAKL
ncbi:Asp-tRNA(Asn)/Glu-tRNA(Gln) amidotransferase subunit GatB [Chitinivibrio alkaliphilus]|uniref:Asp-tRNA(Asn)/Glu-tRNA(Gln) amidotransferase subunit GatB n=1 Tax=Chitinivibrio alkaliphilus TaxID=1505232 RepID=UPI003B835B69